MTTGPAWLSFCRGTIVADAAGDPVLSHAIAEAREYLAEISGASGTALEVTLAADASGSAGGESFRLRTGTRGGRPFARIDAGTGLGVSRGISHLLGRIQIGHYGPRIPGGLDVRRSPRYRLRGMHPNGWAANHPYAFRCWSEDDWRRYVDMLFHLGANHLLLWPSPDIIPIPLSRADEAYLEEVRRVVTYAREVRGMEVWIMQSANRVALSDAGVPDPRHRPYWLPGVQVDLDPGDPAGLDAILRAREPLYRIVDNADGFAIIDSDPGGWNGSPVDAYLCLLRATRALIDRLSPRGPSVKLVSWLWQGWGFTSWDPAAREPVIAETVRGMRERLPGPWMLIAGTGHYLPYLERLGVLDRTVYLPYGAIEAEPSLPFTNVEPEAVRGAIEGAAAFRGLAGFMGNVQCPLLQLPQGHCMMEGLWEGNAGGDLIDLARLLHPAEDAMSGVAAAFAALNATDPAGVDGAIAVLSHLAGSGSLRPGVLGRLLFPASSQVVDDLVRQLDLRRAEAAFASAVEAGTGAPALAPLVADYFRQCLRWEERHGYFAVMRVGRLGSLFPRPPIPRDTIRTWPPFVPCAIGLREALERAGDPAGARFFEPIARELHAMFAAEKVDRGCVEAMRAMMARRPR
jgi:hypothetical protein